MQGHLPISRSLVYHSSGRARPEASAREEPEAAPRTRPVTQPVTVSIGSGFSMLRGHNEQNKQG